MVADGLLDRFGMDLIELEEGYILSFQHSLNLGDVCVLSRGLPSAEELRMLTIDEFS